MFWFGFCGFDLAKVVGVSKSTSFTVSSTVLLLSEGLVRGFGGSWNFASDEVEVL